MTALVKQCSKFILSDNLKNNGDYEYVETYCLYKYNSLIYASHNITLLNVQKHILYKICRHLTFYFTMLTKRLRMRRSRSVGPTRLYRCPASTSLSSPESPVRSSRRSMTQSVGWQYWTDIREREPSSNVASAARQKLSVPHREVHRANLQST